MSKQNVIEYYEEYIDDQFELLNLEKTMAIHFGYQEKGIKSHEESVINMNYHVGDLLNLDTLNKKNNNCNILDAGCGVGGTVITLAKKYPNINFTGITISPLQIKLADKFAEKNHVSSNTDFKLKDFTKTGMSDNYFDGIIAIESICHAEDKNKVLNEMSRILKPNGKIIIVDGFLLRQPSNIFQQVAYDYFRYVWRIPFLEEIEKIKTQLNDSGFNHLEIKDITKNVAKSVFYLLGKSFFYYFGKKNENNEKDFENSLSRTMKQIFSPIIIISILRYFTISSVKK